MNLTITNILRPLVRVSRLASMNPQQAFDNVREVPLYLKSAREYAHLNRNESFRLHLRNIYPILGNRRASAGTASGIYFNQDIWAAKKIFARRPASHIDIGSRIDGFVAHVLCFMPIVVIDIRPIHSQVQGLTFIQEDATELREIASNSVDSMSSLHAAEHFGLGRFSDKVDPNACFKFMSSLERVLAPGGRLYFSVPIGKERVEFNAHRVFAARTILHSMPGLRLLSFSHVSEEGELFQDSDPDRASERRTACGLFEFTK
jgi:Caenorhabditis protein of unknown function, DUF268